MIIEFYFLKIEFVTTTRVLDATDMSCIEDDFFDIVLNMGPFYPFDYRRTEGKCLQEYLKVFTGETYGSMLL